MIRVAVSHIDLNYHSPKAETPALKDVNMSVNDGEFISIVGPSGCGKSTLLNVISGLITPSDGTVTVDGNPVNGYSSKLGYMFQRDQLFEWLTVWDNISLGLKIQKKLSKENIDMLENLLVSYGLWEFKNHRPKELSGGSRIVAMSFCEPRSW